MCDMSHSYVRHDSFISVTELIHMCDMTHSYVWHNSFMCVTWLIHMRDMTHLYVWQDSFICVTWVIHMCDMIARPTYRVAKIIGCLKLQCLCAKEPLIIAIQGATDDRKVVRCLKLQVSFRKRATNHRALLQKMTYKDKASYGSWAPNRT